MKIKLPACTRLLFAMLLVCCSTATYASHIFGVDLLYTYVSGSTYKVTLVVYGDCAGQPTFGDLPTSVPSISVYEGATLSQTINLTIQAPTNGVVVTPVCHADSANTTCTNTNNTVPGIKKFVYTGNATINGNSPHWRFLFTGTMGNSSAGRSGSITNILNPGSSIIQLVDTLNNMSGSNSTPTLTSLPTPFFCDNIPANYNPGAVPPDPSDSLAFFLVPGIDANVNGPVSYTGGVSATEPIDVAPPTASNFSFTSSTGQLSFIPGTNAAGAGGLQKSLVVYNVEQYLNGVLVGTCQREMTFVVLNCSNLPPSGVIDSASAGTIEDSTHFDICDSVGAFSFHINPSAPDSSDITVTSAGLPAGSTFTVIDSGTTNPHGTFNWNTIGVADGTYTFFLTFLDNSCPLASKQIQAYSITLTHVPQLAYSLISEPTCFSQGVFNLIPTGLGSPWTIEILQNNANIQTIPNVFDTVTDSLPPGTYTIRISTSTSTTCYKDTVVTLDTPSIAAPTVTFISPTTCAPVGSFTVYGLNAGSAETVNYTWYNNTQGPFTETYSGTVAGDNTITVNNLYWGTYYNITATLGNCISAPAGPITLATPPPIVITNVTATNPTSCGVCNGTITLYGVPPNQVDTINYTMDGQAQPPIVATSGNDSSLAMINLCQGLYGNIIVSVGLCTAAADTSIQLTAPPIIPNFSYAIHYGCHGDTVVFTNLSQFTGTVYYQWKFGDGTIDTSANPTHVFLTQDSFMVRLFVTNLHCVDSNVQTIVLIHPIQPAFTLSADTICQGQSITFYNNSIGTQPVYFWDFGDGFGSITDSPTHTFTLAGVYQVKLEENDFVPCFDTAVMTVFVDSISAINFSTSDSVLCQGKQIIFTGDYSSIGNIGNSWSFGDGSSQINSNPVYHSYDATGTMQVTLTANYRVCPDTSISKMVTINPYPMLNLGPDTSICPNGQPIPLNDLINAGNPLAHWLWSTGDTTSGILIGSPAVYYTTVTINGCATSDSIWVKNDCYINTPNAFTPNGDGINDYFFPRNLLTSGVTAFSLNIYDRWGNQIFSTTATDGRGWDGKFNNIDQPQGVYIYIIDVSFRNGEKEHFQGNVSLLR